MKSLAWVALVLLVTLVGCGAPAEKPPAPGRGTDLDLELAHAREDHHPLLVLVTEEGRSPADASARALLRESAIQAKTEGFARVFLDLEVSRERAAATRFHLADTPLLLFISPRGVVLSRDDSAITEELILARTAAARDSAQATDTILAALETVAAANATDMDARMQLADFLLAHKSVREAIPYLDAVRHSEAPLAMRIRAHVEESKAHFWIMEPEKGRHVARELIDTLGAASADARAGGYFALGSYEIKGRHKELGRRELDQAIAAAPDSTYGKAAAEERAKAP